MSAHELSTLFCENRFLSFENKYFSGLNLLILWCNFRRERYARECVIKIVGRAENRMRHRLKQTKKKRVHFSTIIWLIKIWYVDQYHISINNTFACVQGKCSSVYILCVCDYFQCSNVWNQHFWCRLPFERILHKHKMLSTVSTWFRSFSLLQSADRCKSIVKSVTAYFFWIKFLESCFNWIWSLCLFFKPTESIHSVCNGKTRY